MTNRPPDVVPDSADGCDPAAGLSPRVAIRHTGKPIGWLLVGNRSGLLELAAQLGRIAKAPPGTDVGRFPRMPYHEDLEVLRCRKNHAGMAGSIVGVLVDEEIDEPEEEVVVPAKHSITVRALVGLFWISLLLVLLLGVKELIRLLMGAIHHILQ